MKRHLDKLIQALVLIRFGQELGTATPAAQAIHGLLDLLANLTSCLLR